MLYQEYYYHVTGALLDKGAVIVPGSYGIILNERYGAFENGNAGSPLVFLYEKELEAYRLISHKNKPSRFNCVFLCHSFDNLMNFIKNSGRVFQFGYKVKILQQDAACHVSDWEKYDNRWSSEGVNDWRTKMQNSITNYWNNTDIKLSDSSATIEILTSSPVEIVQRVF